MRAKGGGLTDADTEGSQDIYQCIVVMLAKKLTNIDVRFKYLNSLPWAFCKADTVEGALHVMTLLRARPLEDQDPLTRILASRLGGDIEKRSRGEPASAALLQEVQEMCYQPLDESLGEGYHRDTNVEKRRAAGSSQRHLKQNTRFSRSLLRLHQFQEKYGERGKAVVLFEWRKWKKDPAVQKEESMAQCVNEDKGG